VIGGPVPVVMGGVNAEHALELAAADDKGPVEALAPERADSALGVGGGVWRSDRRADDRHAFAAEDLVEAAVKLAVAVVEEEAKGLLAIVEEHKQVARLLCDPATIGLAVLATNSTLRRSSESWHAIARFRACSAHASRLKGVKTPFRHSSVDSGRCGSVSVFVGGLGLVPSDRWMTSYLSVSRACASIRNLWNDTRSIDREPVRWAWEDRSMLFPSPTLPLPLLCGCSSAVAGPSSPRMWSWCCCGTSSRLYARHGQQFGGVSPLWRR
jgi:hypothetical protein